MTDPIPEVTPIAYATSDTARRRPPMNWAATWRQVVFSVGVGLLAMGVALYFSHDGREDSSPFPVGFGATLVALAIPWPGRVGRWRDWPDLP